MKRMAIKMHLHPGKEEEYRKRHDAIWPELTALLSQSGISDYSIFLDPETHILFGVLKAEDPQTLEHLQENPVMRKWWSYMKDIMDSHPDDSPVAISLTEVFYLP